MSKTPNQLYLFSVLIRFKDSKQTDPKDYSAHVIDFIRVLKPTDYIFQLERGAEGNLHYQCFIKLEVKKYLQFMQDILNTDKYEWMGENGVQPCSVRGAEALRTYCMKSDDTFVKGPWTLRPIYQGEDLEEMSHPLPWQQTLIDQINGLVCRRTIYWIHNAQGNCGKSVLCKWLKYTKVAKGVPFGTATQIKTNVIAQGPCRVYLVDIPRCTGKDESQRDLFSALEKIKDGDVQSAMNGKNHELFMAPPHLFVFSNDLPNLSHASADRWVVRTINHIDDVITLPKVYPKVQRKPGKPKIITGPPEFLDDTAQAHKNSINSGTTEIEKDAFPVFQRKLNII